MFDALLIFLPIIFLALKKQDAKKELGLFSKGFANDAKNTAILFLVLVVFSFLISLTTQLFGLNDLEKVAQNIDEIKTTAPLLLAYLLVARVVSEEIFFRGFLVKKIGVIGSSIVFGFAHFSYGSIVEVSGAIVLGLLLAKAFEENKNLLPNIVAHFLYNAVFLAVFL